MITSLLAFCTLSAPLVQGYQPIVKTAGVEGNYVSNGVVQGTPKRAYWYTSTTHRVEVRFASGDKEPFPVTVTVKFETPGGVLGIPQKDVVQNVVFNNATEVRTFDIATTSITDNLTINAYVGTNRVATLLLGIVKGVSGTGTGAGS